MKILSVDDSAMVRKIIKGAVEVLNYDFLEARDGQETLSILAKEHRNINLILLDWNMPGMNGLQTLYAIKNHKDYSQIPVLMVTTEREKESVLDALKAGATNYMTKPFTMEDLKIKILECIPNGVKK
ncbi:MAG: response regulator [Bacillota bacterium]